MSMNYIQAGEFKLEEADMPVPELLKQPIILKEALNSYDDLLLAMKTEDNDTNESDLPQENNKPMMDANLPTSSDGWRYNQSVNPTITTTGKVVARGNLSTSSMNAVGQENSVTVKN